MTVEQFISDLDELVDAVCKRLDKTSVAVFGHSWGSALGVLYAARFPEKVAVYIGSGQYGDAAAAEQASYEYALAEAQRRGERRALQKLPKIGPPPHNAKQLWTERTVVMSLEGGMRPRAIWKFARALRGPDHRCSICRGPWRVPVDARPDVGRDGAAEPLRPRTGT
jgi:pimeloyl-ACP methyl ester carboxylesterase